jgi:hypothetical protein
MSGIIWLASVVILNFKVRGHPSQNRASEGLEAAFCRINIPYCSNADKKIKFTLEQDMNAQRRSKGIALLFL